MCFLPFCGGSPAFGASRVRARELVGMATDGRRSKAPRCLRDHAFFEVRVGDGQQRVLARLRADLRVDRELTGDRLVPVFVAPTQLTANPAFLPSTRTCPSAARPWPDRSPAAGSTPVTGIWGLQLVASDRAVADERYATCCSSLPSSGGPAVIEADAGVVVGVRFFGLARRRGVRAAGPGSPPLAASHSGGPAWAGGDACNGFSVRVWVDLSVAQPSSACRLCEGEVGLKARRARARRASRTARAPALPPAACRRQRRARAPAGRPCSAATPTVAKVTTTRPCSR